MRVILHDFGGYAFPVQLSRSLAERGHEVHHAFAAGLQTPHGPLVRRPSDPRNLRFAPLSIGQPFAKYGLVKRFRHERRYGAAFASLVRRVKPDVVLSANTPLGANDLALTAARRAAVPFVPWIQDVLSVGIGAALQERFRGAARPITAYYQRLERRLWTHASSLVLISDGFSDVAHRWRIPAGRVHVIENWAPVPDLPVSDRVNPWACEHGVAERPCLIYSGALGLKHSPRLLLDLARTMQRAAPDARLIVISEGPGAGFLATEQRAIGLTNLQVLGYQPFERLHEVYGSADVLLAVLTPGASTFSVPSKVLSYLCAARPIVAAIPATNPAARVIAGHRAGIVVDPNDSRCFAAEAIGLLHSPGVRETMGMNGRAFAERTFDIDRITSQFEEVLGGAMGRPAKGASPV